MFLIALIAGIVLFILCFKFTALGFWISLLVGVAALVFLRLVFKAIGKMRKSKGRNVSAVEKNAEDIVKEGMEKIRQMNNCARMIQSNDIAHKIREICKTGVEIFDDIKKNPDDAKKAKQFTNYYLDATTKIIQQYVDLSDKINHNPEIETTLKKIEGMLESIKQTFDKQLAGLLEDDLLDINTELAVLKNTIKMEG